MDSCEVQGRSVWKSVARPGKPTYFYFALNDPRFRSGAQPSVEVTVTYLDQGNTGVTVQYDSSDKSVTHPKGVGAFKRAGNFKVGKSGEWKKAVFILTDAFFSGRCNGGDLRLGFEKPDSDPVVMAITVRIIN